MVYLVQVKHFDFDNSLQLGFNKETQCTGSCATAQYFYFHIYFSNVKMVQLVKARKTDSDFVSPWIKKIVSLSIRIELTWRSVSSLLYFSGILSHVCFSRETALWVKPKINKSSIM